MRAFLSYLVDALYVLVLTLLWAIVVVAFVIAAAELLGEFTT